jgi:primase-polymerase (primpol)-like protein
MTETTLAQALGGVVNIPQFFIYKLTWDAAKNKYQKKPCYKDGTPLLKDEGGNEATWTDYTTAVASLAALRARDGHNAWTLGFWFTKDCGYWFLDADSVLGAGGELTQEANYFFQALPGAFCEWSSSGRGLHWVGRGLVPPHSSCPAVAKAVGLEFYTEGRGIAFGLTDKATGSADVDHTVAIGVIAAHWFKPSELLTRDASGVDPAYRGPYDDNELLRRAMQSGSVGSLVSGKASFADLWNRNVAVLARTYPPEPGGNDEFGASHADEALAFMLAFWTGRDAARVERLMLLSALKRDKWDTNVHATYLAGTIAKACAGCSNIYIEQERVTQLAVATTEDARAVSDAWQQKVIKADEVELRNVVVPGIAADGSIDMLDRERLAGLVKTRFADFMINLSIGQCRKMVRTQKVVDEVLDVEVPEFAKEHVYVGQTDSFFNIPTATESSRTTFQATYNRAMPAKQNGDKEDAAKWCLERWDMPIVYDLMYLPGKESVFHHNGLQYANLYTPSSVPAVAAAYTPTGLAGIQAFATMLNSFCSNRAEVYGYLLSWMAFNVQNPGVKVRFAPILKGIQGDAKSMLTSVLAAAMGERNVASVGPSIVMNSGGFTDWAHGACVIGMEELKLEGKNRYAIANAFKDNITNSRVTINRKGKGHLPIVNISNFIAYTNFVDAIPLEDTDRRWFVIFSPYTCVADVVKALGLPNTDALAKMMDAIWDAIHKCPGELRKWLLEMEVPEWFKPNAAAPWTDEKGFMKASGENEDHAIARQVIATGAFGVCREVVSTSCLATAMRAICIVEGVEVPKTSALSKMLGDLGYMSTNRVIKWSGKSHRVWVLSALSNEQIRYHLDTTVTGYIEPPLVT